MKNFRRILTCLLLLTLTACGETQQSDSVEKPQPDVNREPQPAEVTNFLPTGVIADTLPAIVEALNSGTISSEQLVQAYLDRIELVDRSGPTLQSVLSVNPDALAEAKKLDRMRADGNLMGALHGVPILLKDNIETKDNIPTTAGALALLNNTTDTDSPLVAGLRAAGAIILGKTNLSQWANFRSEDSMSGWSALGGQVRNPHILDRNPCGSSSGSGAAGAASLAAGTVGTETNGSIICPSNVNGLVGFKPTVGLVSQKGIIPISESQDTAGPMTKSVMGAAMMMDAMTQSEGSIYSASLNADALNGVRVGILKFATGNYQPVNELFSDALADLEAAGAILVEIEERPESPPGLGGLAYDLLRIEFKDGLNKYLSTTDPAKVTTRTLAELIEFNIANADVELALFNQSIFTGSQAMVGIDSDEYKNAVEVVQKASREDGVDKLLSENNVAVLVAPSGVFAPAIDAVNGDNWPSPWPGYGSPAARAGYPHATVPMGAFRNVPVGLSFIGTANQDAQVLAYAYAYEQQSNRRVTPTYLATAAADEDLAKAMKPYQPNE